MNREPFAHALLVEGARGPGQDRAAVIELGPRLVVVLADGAGGTGDGASAAELVIARVRDTARASPDWVGALEAVDTDRSLSGQATAVIVELRADGITGASVGDSGAWIVRGTEIDELTIGQRREPLVGGGCEPVAFERGRLAGGTLVVASDGLVRYAKAADIARLVNEPDLDAVARSMVELVRLPTGALQDDISIVLVRERC